MTGRTPLRSRLHLLPPAALMLSLVSIACGSSSSTAVSPSSVAKCQVTVSEAPVAIGAVGGDGSVTVAASPECAWTATKSADWVSALTPASGQGNGKVTFKVAANPSSAARHADITFNNTTATVLQAGAPCQIVLAPPRQTVPAGGGGGTIAVTTAVGCAWSVVSDAGWLTATSAGTGPGAVSFTAAANPGAARVGTLTIGGHPFVVTQPAAGSGPCSYSLKPDAVSIGANGGGTALTVVTSESCSWAAASNVPWLTIDGDGTGSGTRTLTLQVTANTGAARTGTVAIADQTFTVSQAGAASTPSCSHTLSAASASVSAAPESVSVTVQTDDGCVWTATSDATWLNVQGSAAGTGTAEVTIAADANGGPARSGVVTIAGLPFTVTQARACSSSIEPTSQSMPAEGGDAAPVAVASPTGCEWTATTAEPWLTIVEGTNGSGDGSVTIAVAPNSGPARSGVVSIAGQSHTVNQMAAGCSYAISPDSASFDDDPATSDPVDVTTADGCTWTARSNDGWIVVQTGATGHGNGTMTFSVSRNNSQQERVGTLTVAGHIFTVRQEGK